MEFEYDGGGVGKGGTVTLFVNGAAVATGRVDRTEPARFSADETFDIGRDTGSPVSSDYQSPFPFTGTLKKVEITLGEDKLSPKERRVVQKMEEAAAQARH
jgi:arylsulfatase